MIKNVMLIDDNKIDLFINQRIIEKYNSEINTRVFTSAISAISFLKILELNVGIKSLTVPDVILVDINMPEMDGFTFFKEFKQLRLLEKYAIEVYMVSSSICPSDIFKAQKENNCSGYIMKPLTVDKFKSVVHKSVSINQEQNFKEII
ncbi:response regulator [Xanthomarina sp.]|uniref:response regulator n=1 Tax=Xanthomarina sp. TaxID=1931211 RepID=UPI002BA95419|nr:response regulator [Xanthomarina sp.]HLV38083.1 response regulator [Xanthomarina sp.]